MLRCAPLYGTWQKMKIVFCDLNTHEVDACKNENIENLRELERTRGHYAHLVRSACTVMIRYMIFTRCEDVESNYIHFW